MALDIPKLRKLNPQIICLGSYPGIIQSIFDFDYLAGRKQPTIIGIIASGRKVERYFFGKQEVIIPVYRDIQSMPKAAQTGANLFINLSSGRRVLPSSQMAMAELPNLVGGIVFAEGLPERHALELAQAAQDRGIWMIGGASVGLVLPGLLKLGAIGGVQARQLEQSHLFTPGSVAVVSSSGGMVNEIIRTVTSNGFALSFSLAVGGERFPLMTPEMAFLAAQNDPKTKAIVYFGELGGQDEYVLVELIKQKRVTKPVVAYIAGTVADLFETPPQFGHAKAMAARDDESARAKRAALAAVGVQAAQTFSEFVASIRALSGLVSTGEETSQSQQLLQRQRGLIASSVSRDAEGGVRVLDEDLLRLAERNSFGRIAMSMFLGHKIKSKELEEFTDFILRLLVDHGPYVSGAVNTIVAARAGRDLVSSLASGLLTIGPRFGGAINQAAATWLMGVKEDYVAADLVEQLAAQKSHISGIGHKKYRIDLPDPRVQRILKFSDQLTQKRFTTFALAVEQETTHKKGNLILNVDGAIAAVLLDLLAEKEGYSMEQLQALVDVEFFNALFILSRSVGFMSHYFDQVRMDEGIFRLNPNQVTHILSSPEK
jgi:succinyl-CoA synthetase alpha subunit